MSKNIIHNSLKNKPNEKGRFGIYGGMFVAETLMPLITNVTSAYNKIKDTNSFKKNLAYYQKHYIGRPSPLYFAERISNYCKGAKIFLTGFTKLGCATQAPSFP